MNPAGRVLIGAGLWALAQLLKGDALGRLNLLGDSSSSTSTTMSSSAVTAGTGDRATKIGAVLRAAELLRGWQGKAPASDPQHQCCGFIL